ncbi:MAG: hypothetical protein JW751_15275 [Polyangiaceae bacterium]|nr:hypothetical protein [Polyangiaceae bacterium]
MQPTGGGQQGPYAPQGYPVGPGGVPPGSPYGVPPNAYPAAPPSGKQSGCRGKTLLVGGGLVGLALLACGTVGVGLFACGGLAYLQGLAGAKQTSVAHEHLPSTCEAVVRVDVKSLLAVSAVKEQVLPAFDEQARKDPDAGKLAAFLMTAQLDPKKDLREVVVCLSHLAGSQPDVVAVIGGSLKPDGVIRALELHSAKGELKPTREVDGLKIIESADEPVFVSQAEDGAILISNQQSLILLAARTSKAFEAYEIPLSEQASGVITDSAMRSLSQHMKEQNPLGVSTDSVGRAIASVSLDTGKVLAKVSFGTANDATLVAGAANVLLAQSRRRPIPNEMANEALQSLSLRAEGKDLVGELVIPRTAIDEGAKAFANQIRKADKKL